MAWFGNDASYQAFVERHGLTFDNLIDPTGELFARFGVPAQPAWAFVAADGTVATVLGALGEDQIVARLRRLAG
jgi:peroxiredoxin